MLLEESAKGHPVGARASGQGRVLQRELPVQGKNSVCRVDPVTASALALQQESLSMCLDLAQRITASPRCAVGCSKIRGQSLASSLLVIILGNISKSDKYAASK